MLTNYSMSSYNAFQLDYTRRFSRGFSWQANYVFAMSLSDSSGDNQSNFEAFLDIDNAKLEKSRTPFDLRHAFKTNFTYDLPFGQGRRWAGSPNAIVSRVIGGWSISGLTTWQSGFPFSIRPERGTLNRTGRSANNGVVTTASGSDLDGVVGFYMIGNGPWMVSQSALNSADGCGVQPDGRAPFQGQIFYNPGAGELGSLGRRTFNGPQYLNVDFGVQKLIQIREGHSLELRMESTNVLNNVFFDTTQTFVQNPRVDYDVNGTNFGRIINQANTPRRIQFGHYYRF